MTIDELYTLARNVWDRENGRRWLWRQVDRDDAIQWAMLSVCKNLHKHDPARGCADAFFSMVIRHAFTQAGMRKKHRRCGVVQVRDMASEPDTVLDEVMTREDRVRVIEAVYSLPPGLGFVVRHVMEGWPMHKIGREMCITRQAVHQRYHKGLEKLAEVLTVG